jgi:hypothetical protein
MCVSFKCFAYRTNYSNVPDDLLFLFSHFGDAKVLCLELLKKKNA